MILASIIALGLCAVAAPWLYRLSARGAGYGFVALTGLIFLYFASLLPGVARGEFARVAHEWIPALGVTLSFRVDGLALLFAMLITGIGTLVVLYATSYMREDPLAGRFFAYLIGFLVSMLGLVLSDNLLVLFIFWELTSITSYLLIGFYHNKAESRKSALQALLVTGLGGLALLAGVIMLGLAGGTFELSELIANGALDPSHPLYTGALICVLLAAFTKSAQYPFHFWLPNAMAAPSPVSAFLHSSTMVKAGVFLLARLSPVMNEGAAWSASLIAFGGVTMVIAAWAATRRTYLKPVLAYSTVSSLGLITMLIGVGGEKAMTAAMAYLLAHSFFKAALFLIAGGVTHETHEKDAEKLGGLRRAMPVSAWCALIVGLSLAGAPPAAGFVGKELALKAGEYAGGGVAVWVMGTIFVAAVFTVMAALVVVWRVFFAPPAEGREPIHAHEVPWAMRVGPIVLAACTLVAAFAPGLFARGMIESAAASGLGKVAAQAAGHAGAPAMDASGTVAGAGGAKAAYHAHLAFWEMFTPSLPLLLSVGALAGGFGLYRLRFAWRRENAVTRALDIYRPEAGYFRVLDGTMWFAALQTRILQNGSLSGYIRVILITLLGLGGLTLLRDLEVFTSLPSLLDLRALELAIALVIAGCTVAATALRSRLATIAVVGGVGYAVALIYVLFGAPDLAMTQFAVETLSVVIFVLVVYHLPRFATYSSRAVRIGDAAMAGVFGSLMAAMVLAASATQVGKPISWFFSDNSYPLGQGKNVINVILVDFRAVDTMGEIVVLGIAAVGVYTLLRLRPEKQSRGAGSAGDGASGGLTPAPASARDAGGDPS